MKPAFKRFAEAWTSCMTMMVQGNLFDLTIAHAVKASKTGALSAFAFVVVGAIFKVEDKVLTALLMGVLTAIADILVHPTHFGPEWGEAAATGMMAAVLCYIAERKLVK